MNLLDSSTWFVFPNDTYLSNMNSVGANRERDIHPIVDNQWNCVLPRDFHQAAPEIDHFPSAGMLFSKSSSVNTDHMFRIAFGANYRK
mmetsp:Transcript_2129/g.4749  ORF Transcript_2129/g.4749 Transcript_2129/m.4749 type:complete len:88 (+) Transcript_2129:840-1103(+)